MIDLEAARTILEARRDELRKLTRSAASDSDPVELDQTRVGRLSRIGAMQGQAMAQETARRRERELQRIDAALARIESGDYGYCVRCDEEIAPGRLEIDPATPTCVACASE